jgi:hypothetical protein
MFPNRPKSGERLVEAVGPTPQPDLPAPLSVFRDIDAPWCPELVVIPPSEFMMNSTKPSAAGLWNRVLRASGLIPKSRSIGS